MQHSRPKVFFIGFNKCATTSFHKFFKKQGYRSFHNARKKIKLAPIIKYNIENKLPVLDGIDDGDVYSDLNAISEKECIEAQYYFKELYTNYSDAYFVLQTRNLEDWLKSRKMHERKSSSFLELSKKIHNTTEEETVHKWKKDWYKHHINVINFFENNDKFLVYDIEQDKIEKIINFLKNDYSLQGKYWKIYNLTKNDKF